MKKKIAILGSTGSIGKILLNIIKKNKKIFNITLLTANKDYKKLYAQAKKYDVNLAPEERISMCETYFGYTVYTDDKKDYFYLSKKLYYEFNKYNGKNPVMVGINIDRFDDYIRKEKAVDEKIHLLGYLGIKNIKRPQSIMYYLEWMVKLKP